MFGLRCVNTMLHVCFITSTTITNVSINVTLIAVSQDVIRRPSNWYGVCIRRAKVVVVVEILVLSNTFSSSRDGYGLLREWGSQFNGPA